MRSFEVTILDATVWLAEADGRRYVLIEPICRLLGVDPAGQLRRVKRQPDLETRHIEHAGRTVLAIEAAELRWLLRTLRPRQPEARVKLAAYRRLLMEIASGQAPRRNGDRRAPVRRSRFTVQDVAEMRRLRAGGESYGRIAKRYGCNKRTIYDLLSGRRMPF